MNTLTASEIKLWAKYRQKYGSLNSSNRNDLMLGQLLLMTASANGVKNTSLYDFVPWLEKPEPTEDDFFNKLAEIASGVR